MHWRAVLYVLLWVLLPASLWAQEQWLRGAVIHIGEHGEKRPEVNVTVIIPTTPLFLALCLSALTMCEIGLVIAPLDPGHEGEALLNRIRMQG